MCWMVVHKMNCGDGGMESVDGRGGVKGYG